MEEFTAITTQEQFDAAIGDRIKRERETLAKKYSDYEDLKQKNSDYEKQIGTYRDYDKTMADLQSKIKGYESHSVKTRIAHETGIPYELIGRLSGETEDDIRKDAETLAKFIGKANTQPAPMRSNEPSGADSKKAALRSLTEQLTNKGE